MPRRNFEGSSHSLGNDMKMKEKESETEGCYGEDLRNAYGKAHRHIKERPLEVCHGTSKESAIIECPSPEFTNFANDLKERFATGQIWVAFDTEDAMPRFYALIRKVFSPGFKLQITWLDADPDNAGDIQWVDEDLPYSCGMFKHGRPEMVDDLRMFSHLFDGRKALKEELTRYFHEKGRHGPSLRTGK